MTWPESTAMAAFTVARSSCGLISGLRTSFRSLAQVKHGAVAATLTQTSLQQNCRWYSISHLSVQERIDKKRKEALLGGGQQRIDAQHKKVMFSNNTQTSYLAETHIWPDGPDTPVSVRYTSCVNWSYSAEWDYSCLWASICGIVLTGM